ncbi:MAG TPA: GatB/YqeY domain-containing protein [Candidatus Sphingobacterium stercoripullorum]|uniref:GatB/YqeY domain-containing protein n=1 Tax=Candidatus Sphingobacterium stercoripullorum TaxID=2838759 RepID=A0A9D1W7F3_9SPHI|nr:GatB/YqeY domain-containing protein [Candidatus Sphingobacterium stercoripullorum]HLR50548.1 GatB/YqeY domain-containing protein [Candidatus Sphingobacterium stercoripullorum]
MSLEEKVNQQIKTAMLEKNQASLRTLRAIKSAILIAKTEKENKEILDENVEMKILQKLLKQRQDSATIYEQQNRTDLLEKEKEEMAIIQQFLPPALSKEDVQAQVKEIIELTQAKTMADMGKVMGLASKKLAGQVDGKTLSEVVKSLLS